MADQHFRYQRNFTLMVILIISRDGSTLAVLFLQRMIFCRNVFFADRGKTAKIAISTRKNFVCSGHRSPFVCSRDLDLFSSVFLTVVQLNYLPVFVSCLSFTAAFVFECMIMLLLRRLLYTNRNTDWNGNWIFFAKDLVRATNMEYLEHLAKISYTYYNTKRIFFDLRSYQ